MCARSLASGINAARWPSYNTRNRPVGPFDSYVLLKKTLPDRLISCFSGTRERRTQLDKQRGTARSQSFAGGRAADRKLCRIVGKETKT